jgi:hypothetical protein
MRSALAVTVLASVWLWSTAGQAQCSKDTECKGDRVCNGGVCQAALPVVAAPPPPAPSASLRRRRSTGLMVSGIVMTSLGTASLATALGLSLARIGCKDDVERRDECEAFDTAALATLLGGFALTSAGVPMLIYGAKKVPVEPEGATISPWLTPSAAGLSVRLRL